LKAVVLSDLRFFTIVTAIQILMESGSDCFFISEEVIKCQEYGSFSQHIIKRIKIWILSKLYNIEIIKTQNINETKNWRGILSSLISQTRDAYASKDKYPELTENFQRQALGAVSVFHALKLKLVKEIFVFNGRFSSSQPICELAENEGIKVWYYEWGVLPFHFTIKPVPTHDFVSQAKLAISIYENQPLYPGIFAYNHQIDDVIRNKLNNTFSNTYTSSVNNSYDVSIFLGSPHELMATQLNHLYSDIDFCKQVVKKHGKKRYAIRSHPNQVSDPSWPIQAAQLAKFADSIGADYFWPDCALDSHQLIKKSDLVVTYFSSIAIDAFFLGAEVNVIGDCMFKYFIEYCRTENSSQEEMNNKMAMLLLISRNLYQHPLHPKWAIMLKLFGWIDYKVVNYINLRM
jgi:hypothetical protein